MLLAVTSACCIREVVGVRLDDHRPAETELLEDVLGERAVDDELLHLEPVQACEILGRRLEERPLVAFEVDHGAERQHGQRLEPLGMQQLDPEVGVAVRFLKLPLRRVELVRAIGRRVEAEQRRHVRRPGPGGGVGARLRARSAGRARVCGRART